MLLPSPTALPDAKLPATSRTGTTGCIRMFLPMMVFSPYESSPTPPVLRWPEIEMFSPKVSALRLNEVLTRTLPRWKRL